MPRLGRLPADIPANADKIYADCGWKGTGDWLGTGVVANRFRRFRSFREARTFARKLKLRNQKEWFAYCRGDIPRLRKRPMDIPQKPERTYAEQGWKGLADWLGTAAVVSQRSKPVNSKRQKPGKGYL
jgi:hypothetical protein